MTSPPSPTRRRHGTLPAVGLVLLAALLVPPGAPAARSQQTIFDATSALLGVEQGERGKRLNELDALGVDTIRIVLQWRSVAPAPGRASKPEGFNAASPRDYPRGAFSHLDAVVRGATERGMKVLLTPSSPFPAWATKSGRSRLADPVPKELRRFFVALGKRYGGRFRPAAGTSTCGPTPPPCSEQLPEPLPRIGFWSVMNEPNQDIFLRPQYRRGRPYSPRLYRRLFLAAQAGLQASGHPRDSLLIGETAPSGGRTGVDPIPFLRGALCLDARFRRASGCTPIRARGWSHHPYGLGLAPFERSQNPGLVNLATIGRLTTALRRAAGAGATTGRLPVFVTEYGVQSRPDREFGVGLLRQAAYLAISEFLAWSRGGIRSYAQYLLRDDPPHYEFSFTTGLRLHSGRAKPSLRSFPLTLMVRRVGAARVRIWGHLRPGAGSRRVAIRYRDRGRGERALRTVRTDGRGYFGFGAAYVAARRWRAESRLPSGERLSGPLLGAYRF